MFNVTTMIRLREINAEMDALFILARLGLISWEEYDYDCNLLSKQYKKAEDDLRPLLWNEANVDGALI
jgi:hypothetical protein